MKRNPEATCETCPYFETYVEYSELGERRIRTDWPQGSCRKTDTGRDVVNTESFCDKHPLFWPAMIRMNPNTKLQTAHDEETSL